MSDIEDRGLPVVSPVGERGSRVQRCECCPLKLQSINSGYLLSCLQETPDPAKGADVHKPHARARSVLHRRRRDQAIQVKRSSTPAREEVLVLDSDEVSTSSCHGTSDHRNLLGEVLSDVYGPLSCRKADAVLERVNSAHQDNGKSIYRDAA